MFDCYLETEKSHRLFHNYFPAQAEFYHTPPGGELPDSVFSTSVLSLGIEQLSGKERDSLAIRIICSTTLR